MKTVLVNNELIAADAVHVLLSNRGFLYGDGFFETLVVRNGAVWFMEGHLKRAQQAMRVLQLEGASEWNIKKLETLIRQLWTANDQPQEAIVKWIVWRDSDGLYAPQQHKIHYLLELKTYRSAPATKDKACIANTVTNTESVYSSFKRLSALHYVLAGLEKTNRELDEIILLDERRHLSEASSSALFWIMKDVLYTPSLDTGCIAGVARQYILNICMEMKLPAEETRQTLDELTTDATVFTANITGISLIGSIEDKTFKNDHPCIQRLQQALFSPSFARSL
ncbi:MAG: hypothetical protein JWO58_1997 [Chitinophagaceae bacterium]|nr:hypothetical protein [Chitinophagaceae bacterium]